jgi:hypothetical protein
MTSLERSVLRSVLANLRRTRRHIANGDLKHAFLLFSGARHELAFGLGITFADPNHDPLWDRVRAYEERVENQLFGAIRRATTPPRLADPAEIGAEITEAILVLRTRDGVDVTREQAVERGRNLAAGLAGAYEIVERVPQWGDGPSPNARDSEAKAVFAHAENAEFHRPQVRADGGAPPQILKRA